MWRAHAEAPAAASAKPAPEGTEAPTQKKRTTGCSLCDQFLDTPCENLMFAFKTASLAREARLWPLDSSSTGDSKFLESYKKRSKIAGAVLETTFLKMMYCGREHGVFDEFMRELSAKKAAKSGQGGRVEPKPAKGAS